MTTPVSSNMTTVITEWQNPPKIHISIKVQRFCLILVGEARLWYESLRPINVDWQGLQNQFRQQYSKIGNTREWLFCAMRSFHFDENTETLDAQILEAFKNTIPTKLSSYRWFKASGRNSNKNANVRKDSRQLAGQSSCIPFMSIKDSYNKKLHLIHEMN